MQNALNILLLDVLVVGGPVVQDKNRAGPGPGPGPVQGRAPGAETGPVLSWSSDNEKQLCVCSGVKCPGVQNNENQM